MIQQAMALLHTAQRSWMIVNDGGLCAGQEPYREHGLQVNWELDDGKEQVQEVDRLVGEYYKDVRKASSLASCRCVKL